jgi:uncharacterized membrane protein YecN with MAPEG domain
MVPITAFYAGLLAIVLVVLGFQVGRLRLRTGISLYDGGDKALAVAIRQHANFIENVPLALLLMMLAELNVTRVFILHALGATLLVARIVHPFGLDYDQVRNPLRGIGSGLTTLVIVAGAALAIWDALKP